MAKKKKREAEDASEYRGWLYEKDNPVADPKPDVKLVPQDDPAIPPEEKDKQ